MTQTGIYSDHRGTSMYAELTPTARSKGGGRYDYISWLAPITRQSVSLLVGRESNGEQPLSEFHQL